MNRAAEGSPNHLFGAASPAFVKAGIFNQDGQVVTAPVVPTVRAGWATRDVVPANLPDPTLCAPKCGILIVRSQFFVPLK